MRTDPLFGSTGIGGHQSARMRTDEWLTPPEIIKALGPFDLDPCAPIARPWPTATEHFTVMDNGLAKPWRGMVWCNPPYGNEARQWLARCAAHGSALALIFARTETEAFSDYVWGPADAVLFLRGRLTFYTVDGQPGSYNGGAPSCIVAYGAEAASRLHLCNIAGALITDWSRLRL